MNIHRLITSQAKSLARMPDAVSVSALIDVGERTLSMEVAAADGYRKKSRAALNRVALAAFIAQVKQSGLVRVHAVGLEYDERERIATTTAFGKDANGNPARIEGKEKY